MNDVITLAHGDGGLLYRELVEQVFLPAFADPVLERMDDSAVCPAFGDRLALTTDSFVVRPRFFPGGDIGRLAVSGTVNDLAVSGAQPLYLTCGMILEAGLSVEELRRICASMAAAAREAGVRIVTGDTKVVEKGACDGIFINTAGVGLFRREPLPQRVRPGDAILVSGSVGDHGLAVLAAREKLSFEPQLTSDAAPLNGLIETLLQAVPETHALRDATRGGVAAVANEWAEACGVSIVLTEDAVPVDRRVRSACQLLGLDPLLAANEGKVVIAVPESCADTALAALKTHPLGRDAAMIGRAETAERPAVSLLTAIGSRRLLTLPEGEQLPRIC
ncbi:MAG: hydrogenase expression/formation protein HypE [Firmicutes bacterium]|nr:hydrogenase expression/formation protein HypE [Bacillota bacterium]